MICLAGTFNDSSIKFVVNGRKLIVTWNNKDRVVSIRIVIKKMTQSDKPWPKANKVKALGDTFEQQLVDGVDEEYKHLEVRRMRVNVRQHLINSLEVVFNDTLFDCDRGVNYSVTSPPSFCLDNQQHALFVLDSHIDDCSVPDSPPFAVASTEETSTGINSSYDCAKG